MSRAWRRNRAVVAAVLLVAGCGGGKGDGDGGAPGEVRETGREVGSNPIGALDQMAEAAKQAAQKMEQAKNRAPVEPVRFDALIPLLPAPEGWQAGEPKGSTTAMGEFKTTVARNEYTREQGADGSASLEVEITDGGYVPMIYAPFHMAAQFSHESTDGYQKGVTVDGNPGIEVWNKDAQSAELTVLVADRFLVHLRGSPIEPQTLRDVLASMRLADLAKLGAPA